jgi:hypothetical protein
MTDAASPYTEAVRESAVGDGKDSGAVAIPKPSGFDLNKFKSKAGLGRACVRFGRGALSMYPGG